MNANKKKIDKLNLEYAKNDVSAAYETAVEEYADAEGGVWNG